MAPEGRRRASEGAEGPFEGHGKTPQASEGRRKAPEGHRRASESAKGPSEGHGGNRRALVGADGPSEGRRGASEGPNELRKVPDTNSRFSTNVTHFEIGDI